MRGNEQMEEKVGKENEIRGEMSKEGVIGEERIIHQGREGRGTCPLRRESKLCFRESGDEK